ncbi:ABC transporter ATP-binding protein [Cellulosimicrobium cellulans]|uniref:ABC transporter ATP-binding protein n=1 Tax=Cellulosimicrobium cellulans TaxID=1710 RepID=UPI0020CEFF19|nr:ATP-binding cassette domain-containing protein [Cellulosimicrobium cellulans]
MLEDVSLSVADGESVAVMAPSGQGKSTLLAIAGLLLTPQQGQVRLDDDVVSAALGRRLRGDRIQLILQSVNLLPRRSVLDNVVLPALAHGLDRIEAEERAIRLLDAVGVRLPDRPARTLSGGQAQRVGVARALVTQPRLVLADEPTANLDAATATDVARVLLTTTRTSTLVATHDPSVAELADRVVTLAALPMERQP